MAVPVLNNAATTDAYSEATTVVFPFPRSSFSMSVFNAAIGYKLLYATPGGHQGWQEDYLEHFMAPALATFNDPEGEGLPPESRFAGVRVRSWVAGVPASVTIA